MIGTKLRELREKKGLLLRQIAAELEVDTAYVSKLERNEKSIKREFIIKLAKIYEYDKDELLTIWLADKIREVVKSEPTAVASLKLILNEINH